MARYLPVPPPSVLDSQEFHEEEVNVVPYEEISTLPPLIINNPRRKIEPEFVSQKDIFLTLKHEKITFDALIWLQKGEIKKPVPKHPICLSWRPNKLCFQLDESPVIHKVYISNRSPKIMYLHCCGLWGDTARMGASWKCYPRTSILLAPGLVGVLFVKARPRQSSPVERSFIRLQVATGHKKDIVFGYFFIPIVVAFHNYVAPTMEEIESEETKET